MNGFILVAVKLLIGFFALIMVINITGKGNLAPNSASDQVQNYVLGGIIGGIIYNKDINILECVGILFIWCMLVLLFRLIKEHSIRARQILDGKALIIIDNGKLNVENCKKAGLCAHDVAFKLRTNNIYSTHKVKRAVVEQNGQLIIILAGEENPKQIHSFVPTDPLHFTPEAEAVFTAGKALWQYYFTKPDVNINASLYDIREYFQGRNDKGKMNNKSEDENYNILKEKLNKALKNLALQIIPKVYEYGFLIA